MLLQNELSPLSVDTLLYFPIIPEEINKTYITEGETINHWKMNNSLTFVTEDDPSQEKNISIYNDDRTEKSSEEIYKMLETWEEPTLFNAFFNGDFEAGNIKQLHHEIHDRNKTLHNTANLASRHHSCKRTLRKFFRIYSR